MDFKRKHLDNRQVVDHRLQAVIHMQLKDAHINYYS